MARFVVRFISSWPHQANRSSPPPPPPPSLPSPPPVPPLHAEAAPSAVAPSTTPLPRRNILLLTISVFLSIFVVRRSGSRTSAAGRRQHVLDEAQRLCARPCVDRTRRPTAHDVDECTHAPAHELGVLPAHLRLHLFAVAQVDRCARHQLVAAAVAD